MSKGKMIQQNQESELFSSNMFEKKICCTQLRRVSLWNPWSMGVFGKSNWLWSCVYHQTDRDERIAYVGTDLTEKFPVLLQQILSSF